MYDIDSDFSHESPERAARDKLVTAHIESCLTDLRGSESYQPLFPLHLLRNGPDAAISRTYFDRSGKPVNTTFWNLGHGFLSMNDTNSSRDVRDVNYNFGQGVISPYETRSLFDQDFEKKVDRAISQAEGNWREGTISREILPGLTLSAHVVDENNEYVDKMTGKPPKYKVTASYATVPLVEEAPITARGLIEQALQQYGEDFERRYTELVNNPQVRINGIGEPYDTPTVPDMIKNILSSENEEVSFGDIIEVAASDRLTKYEKLFILATMHDTLLQSGRTIEVDINASLDDRIRKLETEYMGILAAKEAERHMEAVAYQHVLKNREPVPELTEEERESIIQRNLELLRLKFIDEVDTRKYDDETRREFNAIQEAEGISVDGGVERGLKITYDTSRGKIGLPEEGYFMGDYSRLNTWVIVKGREIEYDSDQQRWVRKHIGTREIRLTHPKGGLTLSQIESAVTGQEAPEEANRRLLPERIIPGEEQFLGPREQWGESEYTPYTQGDSVFLTSLQRFNREYSGR